jgi:16S rRNA G966 N2-methylase RsmD
MGSKRALLTNGLGTAIRTEAGESERVVDLFCGSGAVAAYAAEQTIVPVYAVDLQLYAVTLAQSVISRTAPADPAKVAREWLGAADRLRKADARWEAFDVIGRHRFGAATVKNARALAADSTDGSILRAYGGHYYSPAQALTIDSMIATLPAGKLAALCSAALIRAASKSAAAPGHTAQPFQPTKSALPFIKIAWEKDPIVAARDALDDLAPRHARSVGRAERGDALEIAATLGPTDLVVVDPPYSAVQYSRFYHVLEAVARGRASAVEGRGRYGPIKERPRSDFSLKTRAAKACEALLRQLADAGSRVIFTFPAGRCSNGLSGADVVNLATEHYCVESLRVHGRFSTLGGNGEGRAARHLSEELIISMVPKRPRRQRN